MNLEQILLILGILGAIDLAWRGLAILFAAIPSLLGIRARFWGYVVSFIQLPSLRRKAISSRVEEVTNQTVFYMERYLPKRWIRRARVNWVRSTTASFLANEEIVLRIRPDIKTDVNLLYTLWFYFKSTLFPYTQDLIPDSTRAAIALAIVRASINEYHPYLIKQFDNHFIDAVAQNDAVRDELSDYVRLNDIGLLMGPFIREADHAASLSRFTHERSQVGKRIKAITNHMLGFQPILRNNKPEGEWIYRDNEVSYAFLLVSRPPELRPEIDAYVRRAQVHVANGINRIYVVGRDEERRFVDEVIRSILDIRELKGLEVFALYRDYRAQPGGWGALIGLDEFLKHLHPSKRSDRNADSQINLTSFEQTDTSNETVYQTFNNHEVATSLEEVVRELALRLSDYDGAWIPLANFGSRLREIVPDFNPLHYGGRNLMAVLKKMDYLEFDERGDGPAKAVYIRLYGQ
jgi:hypothetical protein